MAIVTSGSRGIGFTVVRTFLESGAKVAPPPGGGDCGLGAGGAQGDQPGREVMALMPELPDRKSVGESFNQARRELRKLTSWSITPA